MNSNSDTPYNAGSQNPQSTDSGYHQGGANYGQQVGQDQNQNPQNQQSSTQDNGQGQQEHGQETLADKVEHLLEKLANKITGRGKGASSGSNNNI